MATRTARWLRAAALAELIAVCVTFWAIEAFGQSSEVLSERIDGVSRRVTVVENVQQTVDAGARLRVLESDMTEVKWLGRSVAVAVAAQLFALIIGDRRRFHVPDGE